MKKFLFLMAMIFIVAGLMAGVAVSAANVHTGQDSQGGYRTREIFYTENFESGATGWTHWDGAVSPSMWHVYNNGDAQGNVWWMGDPALASGDNIGGYHDHQYLVLDTPATTLTAGNTTLTFKMRMNMEEPGVSGDFDGWDSFNIRVSDNAGLSWTVIPSALITPAYDFASSYAFGSEHGETPPVPAWGGVHEPWVTVTADLSAYAGSSVKVRFAFASDPAYNTVDDPTMYGVMVDDIVLGSYSNNGVSDGQMTYASLVPTAGDFWHLADVGNDAPSPTHIMTSQNSTGTYVPFMLNYLMSPSIVLPAGATQIVADFQLRGTFTDTGVFPDVDYFGWEISPDDGATWRYMSNVTQDPEGMNYVYSSAPDSWASMINSYTLDGDITIFAGNTVKFRWYFQSNDTVDGTPLQIDNFQIFSVSPFPAPPNLVYPINGATGLPMTGFDLDWTASSLGALPDYYVVFMDMVEDNLVLDTFNPTYASPDQTVSLYNPVTDGLLTYSSNQRWYWRVGAYTTDPYGEAYSDIFRFDIVDASVVVTTFPWEEGFEDATFPPDNWSVADIDAGGSFWNVNTNLTYVHSGTKSAAHLYSAAVPDPGQNGWMVTPGILLPDTGVHMLSWWNYNNYPTWMVYNGVKINTVSSPADPGWVEIWSQDAPAAAWSNVVLNLADYAGQLVYFAFIYQGYDADDWFVDDVSIFELAADEMPPSISHLPVLNTLRTDIPYPVVADIVDDAIWNNPVTANMFYSTDGGTNWSAAIPMTVTTAPTHTADIPAQALGTTVTYRVEAEDSESNAVVSSNYAFSVNDPTWIQYDIGGTGYTGFPTYVWGPMIYYENPLYGTGIPLQLLAVDGAVHNNNAGNPNTPANLHIYSDDGVDLVDLITPLPVSFVHRTRLETDLSALNIQITTPWFWISYEDMPLACYFMYDATYDYTTLYLTTGGAIYTSSSTGEWCIGAYVQTGAAGLAAPEVTIAYVGGNTVLSWPEVPGAASYNVYGASDPYAALPWTLIGNTLIPGYTHTGMEARDFFKVTADSEVPTRATLSGMPSHFNTNAPTISGAPQNVK